MIILFVLIEIGLIVFTVATDFYAEAVPFLGALHVPAIWISVVFGIVTAVYIAAKIYVEINGKRNKKKGDENK